VDVREAANDLMEKRLSHPFRPLGKLSNEGVERQAVDVFNDDVSSVLVLIELVCLANELTLQRAHYVVFVELVFDSET